MPKASVHFQNLFDHIYVVCKKVVRVWFDSIGTKKCFSIWLERFKIGTA